MKVKRDTPQATVASLIKVYAADDHEKAGELYDPSLLAHEAAMPSDVCGRESIKETKCKMGGDTDQPCDHFKKCACSGKGKDAPAKAFTDTIAHRGFAAAGLDPEKCEINSADERGAGDLRAELNGHCDFPAGDKFAKVKFVCGDQPYWVVVRQASGSGDWAVVGFAPDTGLLLNELATKNSAEKKREDLNKDLK